jgi:hypothetical protein
MGRQRTAFLVRALLRASKKLLNESNMIVKLGKQAEGNTKLCSTSVRAARKDLSTTSVVVQPFISVAYDNVEAVKFVEWYIAQQGLDALGVAELGLQETQISDCYHPDEATRKCERMVRPCEPLILLAETTPIALNEVDGFLQYVFGTPTPNDL